MLALRSPHGRADRGNRAGERGCLRRGSLLDEQRRPAADDDLDAADLIDAAFRSVHVLEAHGDALDPSSGVLDATVHLRPDPLLESGAEGNGRTDRHWRSRGWHGQVYRRRHDPAICSDLDQTISRRWSAQRNIGA
jgi:hypothetical protein